MSERNRDTAAVREPVLSPVDRVSELLFGLFMALTFVGAVSVAKAGEDEIRSMFAAALGCNLAWGLVDAVMYLVRTVTDRGRSLTLVRSVRAAADAGSRPQAHRKFAFASHGGARLGGGDRGDSRANRRAGVVAGGTDRCVDGPARGRRRYS